MQVSVLNSGLHDAVEGVVLFRIFWASRTHVYWLALSTGRNFTNSVYHYDLKSSTASFMEHWGHKLEEALHRRSWRQYVCCKIFCIKHQHQQIYNTKDIERLKIHDDIETVNG